MRTLMTEQVTDQQILLEHLYNDVVKTFNQFGGTLIPAYMVDRAIEEIKDNSAFYDGFYCQGDILKVVWRYLQVDPLNITNLNY